MKTIPYFILLSLLGLLLSGCGRNIKPDATQLPEAMKGYELYSWQEGEHWKFSLLFGTNREKTLEEIKSRDTTLPDLDTLITLLEKVPSGQYVTWSSRESLSFPPDNIIKQIEKICKDKGLILAVAK